MDKIALITGANRGIGLETGKQLLSRGWTVIFTARKIDAGKSLVEKLSETSKTAWFVGLDVTDKESIKDMADSVVKEHGRLDVLINNAGILIDEGKSILTMDLEDVRKTMETNLYGPMLVTRALLPVLRKSKGPRVLNVSSTMGQLSGMGSSSPAYRMSKTALNSLTVILSNELRGAGIRVNTIHPGWVRTDMGGRSAPKSLEEGADTIVWLATEPDIPTGRFFTNRKEIAW